MRVQSKLRRYSVLSAVLSAVLRTRKLLFEESLGGFKVPIKGLVALLCFGLVWSGPLFEMR